MQPLVSQLLAADPRFIEAKTKFLAALADSRRRITAVRPPDPDRQISYAKLIEQFGVVRGSSLYYPYLGSGAGNGVLVELEDGSVKYDMISGIGVHFWGHADPDLAAAAFDAAAQNTVMQGNLQQNFMAVAVCQSLLQLANTSGARVNHCFLSSSGAMANENAMKLMFQKRRPAGRVLAFGGAFAGRTLVLSQITDKPSFRDGLPPTVAVDYIPFFDPADPQASRARSVQTLHEHLSRYSHQHAFMCLELIQGEGGYHVGDRDFFLAILQILKANSVAVWIDEVQTFGRTLHPFAFQSFGLDDLVDVVTVGKLLQVCATLFTDEYKPAPGLVSQTFTAGTSALCAAQVVLDKMSHGDLFGPGGRIDRLSKYFTEKLTALSARHPNWITGPFGHGGMIAFTPLGGEAEKVKKFLQRLFHNGVIAFVAGENPTRARFLPPMGVLNTHDIDAVCEILENTLAESAK